MRSSPCLEWLGRARHGGGDRGSERRDRNALSHRPAPSGGGRMIGTWFAHRHPVRTGETVRSARTNQGVLVDTLPTPARMRQDDRALPRHTHLSDEALVALVARGDERRARGAARPRRGRVAYGIAFRILRDDRLAEDAVQEGFLAVWRSAATFRPERAKVSTWIVTPRPPPRRRPRAAGGTSSRRAARGSRSPGGRRPGGLGGGRGMARLRARSRPGSAADASRRATGGDRAGLLRGYSQSELAERLGVPLGTVESRMFAGLHGCARCWTTPEQRDHGRRDHELIAGYALDALDDADRARAKELLATSEEARGAAVADRGRRGDGDGSRGPGSATRAP